MCPLCNPVQPEVEVVGYVEMPPDNVGMMKFIQARYAENAEHAREMFFCYPNVTEDDFQKIITGKWHVNERGNVTFDD